MVDLEGGRVPQRGRLFGGRRSREGREWLKGHLRKEDLEVYADGSGKERKLGYVIAAYKQEGVRSRRSLVWGSGTDG